ncbi:MAG TPA: hypothetical protein VHM88_10430, partial [Candidatus Acidoferrales bacterium]|nr:hypothetical protein [Candidatus Acidoferrales bacterium]
LIVAMVLSDSQTAYPLPTPKVMAIPAFARKYGVPCSACHTAWPELNWFGQTFRDNGYQMMNERDSPIWQNPSYWPMSFRIQANWHRERANHQPVDATPGDSTSGLVDGKVTTRGFDLSGLDIWTGGTVFKNISFVVLPSSDSFASFHFESAFVRFDNLLKTRWLNVKLGKFELDNLVSEKRFLFISGNGGLYQNYHFAPVGSLTGSGGPPSTVFGLGDNQLGVEVSGHSINSYTRYGVAVVSSNDGKTGLPSSRAHDVYLTFSQAFPMGSLGVQRLGVYAYLGQRPTFFQTTGGAAIAGAGMGNKPFYRVGFAGDLFLGKFEFLPFFMRGHDNVFLGTATPANKPLPPGARSPTWNGGFVETHYYFNPQFVLTGRWEIIRMAQQAFPAAPVAPGAPSIPENQGNIDAYSAGFRWYPIMFSRAGVAWHTEYSFVKSIGIAPLSGTGVAPSSPATRVWSNSLLFGFDFAF